MALCEKNLFYTITSCSSSQRFLLSNQLQVPLRKQTFYTTLCKLPFKQPIRMLNALRGSNPNTDELKDWRKSLPDKACTRIKVNPLSRFLDASLRPRHPLARTFQIPHSTLRDSDTRLRRRPTLRMQFITRTKLIRPFSLVRYQLKDTILLGSSLSNRHQFRIYFQFYSFEKSLARTLTKNSLPRRRDSIGTASGYYIFQNEVAPFWLNPLQ